MIPAGRVPREVAGEGAAAEGPPLPRVVVFSSLFPSAVQPYAGLFIRERAFRVARHLPLVVVSPRPWSPLDGLIRRIRPGFRLCASHCEVQNGIRVEFSRFFSVPGILKRFDGDLLAWGGAAVLDRLWTTAGFDLIDAHFAYPDGYAATLLGRRLGIPVTITLRGTEARLSRQPAIRKRMMFALGAAARIFAVSESLKRVAMSLGAPEGRIAVIPNGVDLQRFYPEDRREARVALGLAARAPVLISVGGLVERKGFHRVIELLPALRQRFPGLTYVIVGGASAEGDWEHRLRRQVAELRLEGAVRFLGNMDQDALRTPLSAADVFVLATRNEGWANVFLEAMACGLPVVTTDVGGNREVICEAAVGSVVPFGRPDCLEVAIMQALERPWDRRAILAYATAHAWDARIDSLVEELKQVAARSGSPGPSGAAYCSSRSEGDRK